ncbi:MAG: hypothetical protein R3F11_26405 [Verrucomicrobiales bacterium]
MAPSSTCFAALLIVETERSSRRDLTPHSNSSEEMHNFSASTLRDVKVKLGGNLSASARAEVTADAIRVEGDSTAAITGGGTLETFVLDWAMADDDSTAR